MSKNPVVSVRLSALTRTQIDELIAKWECSMGDLITILVDRQYQQETRMKTYYVETEMLGDEATDADAERMVELLQLRNIDAEIGSALQNRGEDIVSDKTWMECLDIISAELNKLQETQTMSSQPDYSTLAKVRVNHDQQLDEASDILLDYEYDNQDEHLQWVATADRAEIVSWIDAMRAAEDATR